MARLDDAAVLVTDDGIDEHAHQTLTEQIATVLVAPVANAQRGAS
jgi:hypothetical protein